MQLPVTYVWTHDSIGLGEDGPTHQPIEHLAALRAIPGLDVVRPADANETAVAWRTILEHNDRPGRPRASPGRTCPTFPRGPRTASPAPTASPAAAYVLADGRSGGERPTVDPHRHRLRGAARRRRPASSSQAEGIRDPRGLDAVPGVVRRAGRRLPRHGAAAVGPRPGLASRRRSRRAGASSSATPAASSRSSTSAPRPTTRRLYREFGITAEAVAAGRPRQHRRRLDARRGRPAPRTPRRRHSAAPSTRGGSTMTDDPDSHAARPTQGVSIWLDDLSRERLSTGNLAEADRRRAASSASRPTRRSSPRRSPRATRTTTRSATLAARGVDVDEAVRAITTDDVRAGPATCCAPVVRRAPTAVDGRVSIEVDPRLAHDTDADDRRGARRCGATVDRPNVFIKIPATVEGLPAITARDRRGHQRQRHADLLPRALPRGDGRLPDRARAGASRPASTCRRSARSPRSSSSRVDTEIDKRLDAIGTAEADGAARQGRRSPTPGSPTRRYEEVVGADALAGARGRRRAAGSARCGRRPASRTRPTTTRCTSTELVAPDTVNTMPEATLDAVADHGEITGDTVTGRLRRRPATCSTGSSALGIDYDDVVDVLEHEGVEKFEKSLGRAARRPSRRAGARGGARGGRRS